MPTVQRGAQTLIGASGSYNGGTVKENKVLSTADATATVILSVPLSELEAVKIQGHIIGIKSDLSAMVDGIFDGGWRRASGGNVTANGTPVATAREDHAGSPTFAWVANTTDQTVELKVTGVAAETWRWEVNFRYTKIK
jgi:hypothetical protein